MSYDLQIYDSDGTVLFDSGTLALRETDVLEVQAGQSGTYSVPEFDDNKGVIFLNSMYGFTDEEEISYSWDNSSKVFSYNLSSTSSGTFYFLFMSFK